MQLKFISVLFFVFFGLASCGSERVVTEFNAPASKEMALIKFYDDANGVFATISISEGCDTQGRVRTWRWVNIPAGIRVYVQHANVTSAGSCMFRYSFVPENGASYISDLKEKVFSCTAVLYKQGNLYAEEKLPVPTLRRESSCQSY